jgi:hypothetical protein
MNDRFERMVAISRCEIRCHCRADDDEFIRSLLNVEQSGLFGFDGHPRMGVAVGVGSTQRSTVNSAVNFVRFNSHGGSAKKR